MAQIIWTATALSDIDSIAEYISLDSAFYAKRFVEKIFLATDKLEKYPEIGKEFVNFLSLIIGKYFLRNTESFTGSPPILFISLAFIILQDCLTIMSTLKIYSNNNKNRSRNLC